MLVVCFLYILTRIVWIPLYVGGYLSVFMLAAGFADCHLWLESFTIEIYRLEEQEEDDMIWLN